MRGSRAPYAPARLAHSGCPDAIQATMGVFRSDRVALWEVNLRMETLRAVTHARCLAKPGGRPFYLGAVGCALRLGSPPDASVPDGGWLPVSRAEAAGRYGRPAQFSEQQPRPTVSPLLTPVASRNVLLYQSLPTSVRYRHANWWRRKDDTGVGTAARLSHKNFTRLSNASNLL